MSAAMRPTRRHFLCCSAALAGGLFTGLASAGDAPALGGAARDLVHAALHELDASQLWDVHAHLLGTGDAGSGCSVHPSMQQWWHPLEWTRKRAILSASGIEPGAASVDRAYVERLQTLAADFPQGARWLLFAFERAHDDSGRPRDDWSTFHVPNAYAAAIAAATPQRFGWVASIHPYREDAIDALDAAIAGGALAIKWLPSAMNIDPRDARCKPFYARLARHRVPLIVHCGEEKAVPGAHREAFGNPLLMRAPLEAGVRVTVAHAASLGDALDIDRRSAPQVPAFSLFARLMDEAAWRDLLLADVSAVLQINRSAAVARTLLRREDWHGRLVHGSDHPLPGVDALVSPLQLAARGLLDADDIAPLREIRAQPAAVRPGAQAPRASRLGALHEHGLRDRTPFRRRLVYSRRRPDRQEETHRMSAVQEHAGAAHAAHPNQFALLRERRFAPFFWTQFLGAGNDNLFKFAFTVLVTYQLQISWLPASVAGLAIGALFILPFLLFSATSGQLADKFDKTRVIRFVKSLEIAIMALAGVGFWLVNVPVLLVCVFLMGLHSTLFGPVKFAYLPQHLSERELTGGNGMVEMGTFVAILLGQVAGGLLIAMPVVGPHYVALGCFVLALLGRVTAQMVPPSPSTDPDLRINWNPFSETWRNLKLAHGNLVVFRSLLGISWMWFFGSVFLALFPAFAKDVLGGSEQVAALLLVVFSLGIGIGSLLCETLSRRHVEIGLVPFGAIGMSVFAIDLYFATRGIVPAGTIGAAEFVSRAAHWRVMADLALLALFAGLYSVPMYALIQLRATPTHRARIIAANNILNALFMIASALMAGAMLKAGFTIPQIFLVTGLLNALVAAYIFLLVPEYLLRFLALIVSRLMYRFRVEGDEHIPTEGAALLVCNHVSFVDPILLMAASPRPIRFIMDHRIFATPVLGWLFRLAKAIPVAPQKEDPQTYERAFAEARRVLDEGDLLLIFPEGGITRDGTLQDFKGGVMKVLETNPVPVVPLALTNLWGSFFSRAGGTAMSQPFRRGPWSHVGLRAGAAIEPTVVDPQRLQARVQQLIDAGVPGR